MRALYIILALFIIGCTSNRIERKFHTPKSQTNYINHNPRSDAFIVGVGEYKNNIRPLDGVKKDLVNIKRLFKYLNINSVTTLKNNKATLKNIREVFTNYIHSSKNRKGNRFIFYYSGHGVQVTDESGDEKDKKDEATALYDIDLNDKDFITQGILLDDELHSLLAQIESNKIIIFDKCHSGSSHRGYNPFIKSVNGEYKLLPKFLKNINKHIKNMNKLKNYVIFSATKDDQEAEDSPIGGLFTNSFIDGILYKKADINQDNKITVAELEKFCGKNISTLAVNISKKNSNISLKGAFDPYFIPKKVKNKTISSIFNIESLKKESKLKPLLESTLDSLVSDDIITLTLIGGKTIFKEHDRIRFEITSTKNGYLNIFIAYKDSYKLFMKNQKIKADKLYTFPTDFMTNKYLIAKRPFGETKIYALLSKTPLSIKRNLSKKEDDLSLTNYFRKGIMIKAKKQDKKANILSIGQIKFKVFE